MATMDQTLASQRWDAEYRKGRYVEEPPLPFVEHILTTFHHDPSLRHGIGLYIGCGNGRNYLPLVHAGLHLYGLDLSPESLRQLATRDSTLSSRLLCSDFRMFRSTRLFHYIIAIQVFQHGTESDVARYFANVRTLLAPGGLFFLRVNAVSTQIYEPHTIIEHNDFGGMTVQYHAGPKQGLPVHFYARDELLTLTQDVFDPVTEPQEDIMVRPPPKTGFWAQWEGSWKRR